MESARLFLALWPDAALRDPLARYRDAWRWPAGVSPVPSGQLHLTLHFIGPVPRQRLPLLGNALEVACAPFELALGMPEVWPRGLAVLRPASVPDALVRLRTALGTALEKLDLPVDTREFRPHITLARRAPGATPPAIQPAFCWRVNGYVLVESVPGAGYRIERHFPFS